MAGMINLLLAGFGGQGILFAGKIAATAGMTAGKQVSWLPSYGPEMRGGTANCSVCIDEEPISCPMVTEPDILMVMNQPSYQKFAGHVASGGALFYDSSLISDVHPQDGVRLYGIPATEMAQKQQLTGLANIILLGYVLNITQFSDYETVCTAIRHCISPKKVHLLEPNLRALQLGFSFEG